MKKVKIGSIEFFACAGVVIWAIVLFLRTKNISNSDFYLFVIGMLPNLAAAWISTLFGKWIIVFLMKRSITIKIYRFLCLSIFLFAVCSELIYDMFLGSSFDIYDILITAIAQIIIFIVPIRIKDKSLSE